jgi:hypothetical protein
MMVATLKIPLERRNKRTGRTEKARIWEITDRTVRTWLNEAVETAAADGVSFSMPVTPHTFRHSYAMHMLYADPAEGIAESDGPQVGKFDGGVYESVCARCRCKAQGAVSDARARCGGHAERKHLISGIQVSQIVTC